MRFRIPSYQGDYKILSLALDDATKEDLINEDVDFLYVDVNKAVIFPEQLILTEDSSILEVLNKLNNYDVLEIMENGMASRCYDDSTVENTFFITEKCNSNCVMCPSPEHSRRRGNTTRIDDLINLASHIPTDTPHITITGGEPFMVGKELFKLLEYCKHKFEDTEFQILTNGRVFSLNEYCELFVRTAPNYTIVGIPLHGSSSMVHDAITQTPNSFQQTFDGLRRLQNLGVQTEIRIVVSKNNIEDLPEIARLIIDRLDRVTFVSIMAMEMTGSAFINADKVWIPYTSSFTYVKKTVEILVNAGIDTRLYNFPLCTVEKPYRTLCCKSISSWKVRYASVCDNCSIKPSCGGVFAGTMKFVERELKAVL